ncbi:hypothetical protein BH09BAC6_BH09BAC6_24170 [soil metagenome]
MEILNQSLEKCLAAGAELGVVITLVKTGQVKPYLNKSEAFLIYGRSNVENWFEMGWLKQRKDGNYSAAWRIDRIEIEVVAKSIALLNFL